MSRFIDKLNQVSKAMPQPMGFGVAQPVSPELKLLLIASLAQANVDGLAEHVAGADAGLLTISTLSSGAKTLQEICQVVSDIPWGVWLRDIDRGEIKQIVKVGCDFVVFPAANTSLAILQDDEVGKILQVEASVGEGLLRAEIFKGGNSMLRGLIKRLGKRLGIKTSKQVLLDKDRALQEFKVSYKNLMKIVFTQPFGDGLKLIQQARETEKKAIDELADEIGLPSSVRHEVEK